MPLVWPQKTVLWQTDDEWYQLDQTKSTTKYLGFFNSTCVPPRFPVCHLQIFHPGLSK